MTSERGTPASRGRALVFEIEERVRIVSWGPTYPPPRASTRASLRRHRERERETDRQRPERDQ